MKRQPNARYLIVLLALLFTACTEKLEELTEIDETRYRASFAVPILDSQVSLDELVANNDGLLTLTVAPDGLIVFSYESSVPPVTSEIIFNELEVIGAGVLLSLTSPRQALPFAQGEDQILDRLITKGGELRYILTNTYDFPVDIELSLPDARLNGAPFRISGSLPAYSGQGDPPALANPDTPVDLTGYELVPSESDSIYAQYVMTGPDGELLTPSPGSAITLEGLTFSRIDGYLGQELYGGLRDTLEIDFFEDYLGGDVSLSEPTITITVDNSFGVPARAVVRTLRVVTADGRSLDVTGPGIENGFDFNLPAEAGETARTTFVFDRTNSNIADILNARPVAVDYELSALIHPDGNTDRRGFALDSSAYSATVEVDLPLIGTATNFLVGDTFDIDIGERYDDIEDVLFRLTTYNGLPLDVEIEGFFLDENGEVTTTLTQGALPILNAAPISTEGLPTGETRASHDFFFPEERVGDIRRAERLILQARVATASNASIPVKIFTDQQLRVLLGAVVTVSNP